MRSIQNYYFHTKPKITPPPNNIYASHKLWVTYVRRCSLDAFIMPTCPCKVNPTYTPLLYSKIGVYRGIHYALTFSLNHRLWVLIEAVLACAHNLCFEQKLEKYLLFLFEN